MKARYLHRKRRAPTLNEMGAVEMISCRSFPKHIIVFILLAILWTVEISSVKNRSWGEGGILKDFLPYELKLVGGIPVYGGHKRSTTREGIR